MSLSKILYSAGGFQDFLNSVKNVLLMPENAKKIIKKLATRWSHVLGPILIDYLTSTYLLIWKIQNQKTKKRSQFFLCRMYENVLGEIKLSVAVLRLKLLGCRWIHFWPWSKEYGIWTLTYLVISLKILLDFKKNFSEVPFHFL